MSSTLVLIKSTGIYIFAGESKACYLRTLRGATAGNASQPIKIQICRVCCHNVSEVLTPTFLERKYIAAVARADQRRRRRTGTGQSLRDTHIYRVLPLVVMGKTGKRHFKRARLTSSTHLSFSWKCWR